MAGLLLLGPVACGGKAAQAGLGPVFKPLHMSVTSPQVTNGRLDPSAGCGGADQPPTVNWTSAGRGAQEYLVHIFNLDSAGPSHQPYTQWLVYNIPMTVRSVSSVLPTDAIVGPNDGGKLGYVGPCPQAGRSDRIEIQVLALKRRLHVDDPEPWSLIMGRADPLTFTSGSIVASYSR